MFSSLLFAKKFCKYLSAPPSSHTSHFPYHNWPPSYVPSLKPLIFFLHSPPSPHPLWTLFSVWWRPPKTLRICASVCFVCIYICLLLHTHTPYHKHSHHSQSADIFAKINTWYNFLQHRGPLWMLILEFLGTKFSKVFPFQVRHLKFLWSLVTFENIFKIIEGKDMIFVKIIFKSINILNGWNNKSNVIKIDALLKIF